MAGFGKVQVGIKMEEPSWSVVSIRCMALSMRAMGYLEADRPDLALEALKEIESLSKFLVSVSADKEHDLNRSCSTDLES